MAVVYSDRFYDYMGFSGWPCSWNVMFPGLFDRLFYLWLVGRIYLFDVLGWVGLIDLILDAEL